MEVQDLAPSREANEAFDALQSDGIDFAAGTHF